MYLLGSVQLRVGLRSLTPSPGVLPLDPAGSKASRLPNYGSALRASHSPSPQLKNQTTPYGHGASCGLSATAELVVKYKLVCLVGLLKIKIFWSAHPCSAPALTKS